jgi:methionyl aminopeptidase
MTVDGEHDVQGLRLAGRAVADARDAMLRAIEPGISSADLDAIAREVLRRHGARSAPQLAYGFPGTTCISINHEAAHGIPSTTRRLRDGDVVNVDVSAELDGYWADTGASAAVGTVAPHVRHLLDATREAQRDGMRAARAGRPLRHIGRAVQRCARRHRLRVIANLCGHGVGRSIHESPSVPAVEDVRDRTVLWEGLVLAIEPFLSPTATLAIDGDDGWTLTTVDGSLAAQFEHTLIVTNGEPIVLTERVEATR